MKNPWPFISLFLIAFLCVGISEAAAAQKIKLVAASYSDRYHVSTCKVAQNIPAEDLLVFKTPEQAIQAGFRPCRKCDPTTESRKNS